MFPQRALQRVGLFGKWVETGRQESEA